MDGQVRAELLSDHPGVLLVTIDRPPVNAMTVELYEQLIETFNGVEKRDEVSCVVFTGAGERAFVAGAELKALAERTPESAAARFYRTRRAYEAIRSCAVPVIGAINGAALGAGFIMVSVCNIIIASDHAAFGLPEINVGGLGGSVHLGKVLPKHVVQYMALTGERVDGHYLERLGMVHKVVPRETLLDEALAMADQIAAKSPALMRIRKESLLFTEEMEVREGYRVEQLFSVVGNQHPDANEAARAVREKRTPNWTR